MSIRSGQSELLRSPGSISALEFPATGAVGHYGADPHGDGRANRQERVDEHVPLREPWVLGEAVRGRLARDQEERVQPTERTVLILAVELRVLVTLLAEILDALAGECRELVPVAKPDRLGRAGL